MLSSVRSSKYVSVLKQIKGFDFTSIEGQTSSIHVQKTDFMLNFQHWCAQVVLDYRASGIHEGMLLGIAQNIFQHLSIKY